jgi:hypothetical protein
MKGHVDKSMGIVTPIVEDLARIKPTDPLRFRVYCESIKREPKIRGIYECRCDERLQTKLKEFTRLPYTGLRLDKREARKKRNYSDSSGNSSLFPAGNIKFISSSIKKRAKAKGNKKMSH